MDDKLELPTGWLAERREYPIPNDSGGYWLFAFKATRVTDGDGLTTPGAICTMCRESVNPEDGQLRLHVFRHIHILPHEL